MPKGKSGCRDLKGFKVPWAHKVSQGYRGKWGLKGSLVVWERKA